MSGSRAVASMDAMATPKKPADSTNKGDRHKPSRMFRVPLSMAKLLDQLGQEELGSSSTEQLKNAIREYLQRKGKLNPPPKPTS